MSQLALGGAQLAQKYGISNKSGAPDVAAVNAILNKARSLSINTVDTAPAYSECEALLGRLGVSDFKVISKVSGSPMAGQRLRDWLTSSVLASLARLRIERLDSLLIHDPQMWPIYLERTGREAVKELKDRGLIEKFGVSIYDSKVLNEHFEPDSIDVVQAPLNAFDKRIIKTGWMDRLVDAGVHVDIRSVFLQGLLLMKPEDMDPYFMRWANHIGEWRKFVEEQYEDSVAASLGVVSGFHHIRNIIVGVQNSQQLEAIGKSFCVGKRGVSDFSLDDTELIDPSKWVLKRSEDVL